MSNPVQVPPRFFVHLHTRDFGPEGQGLVNHQVSEALAIWINSGQAQQLRKSLGAATGTHPSEWALRVNPVPASVTKTRYDKNTPRRLARQQRRARQTQTMEDQHDSE